MVRPKYQAYTGFNPNDQSATSDLRRKLLFFTHDVIGDQDQSL